MDDKSAQNLKDLYGEETKEHICYPTYSTMENFGISGNSTDVFVPLYQAIPRNKQAFYMLRSQLKKAFIEVADNAEKLLRNGQSVDESLFATMTDEQSKYYNVPLSGPFKSDQYRY